MASSASKYIEVAIATLCFLTGASIYLLWRDDHLLVHQVIRFFGLHSYLAPLRTIVGNIYLPDWIRFCLPDGLWSVSYILFIDALVRSSLRLTAIIPMIGAISEILQYFDLLPGTFDILDLLFYIIPYITYCFCYELRKRRKKVSGKSNL